MGIPLRITGIKTVYAIVKFTGRRNTVSLLHPQNGLGAYALFHTRKEDVLMLTKRISDYSLKGEVDYARTIFEEMSHPDTVSWNVMIRGYVENHRIGDARELFDKMPVRSSVSWNTMIMAYAKEGKTHIAMKLFIVMPDKDVVSWTAIITALSRGSHIEDAWRLFKLMPEPSSVSWASIISGFQQNGLAAETLCRFKEMLSVGVQPTSHSFTSALTASADLAMLSLSQQLYSQLLKRGFESNTHIGNSAISMFIKSGSFRNARRVLEDLPQPDIVTWNAMVVGYGQNGYGIEAIMSFHQMQKAKFLPDRVSFLGLLHGCSHCGYVEKGKQYFHSMESNYGISPGPEHYACMVDLLSRAGFLKEAHKLIKEMPFEPTCIFWRTLLNGCRIWGDLELGFYAANRILELDPYNSSACLMVIDIYASAGRWKEVLEMRRQMRKREARKELGCSWIEIKGRIHLFTTRDDTHPEADHIYLTLLLLSCDIAHIVRN
ncbi:pentatricopeptide repeat-containing protein At4g02750-like [Vitis riparia]|uniref:pentatricopeptide repeat-containing protein At4g02750-like n=1 Tax=Vitis riparia TaxID=96939 RepID=UPI00155A45E6|nr:pentatricopeptide repeat-containing protein At4g02750-like [Vitis riparia]